MKVEREDRIAGCVLWPAAGGESRQKGFALLVVIMVLLLVSFLAAQLTFGVRTELKIAANFKGHARGRFLAEAGINLGLFRLLDKPLDPESEELEKLVQALPYTATLPTGEVTYTVTNESGKMDLNRVPQRLLELFLEYKGLDDLEIMTVIDSLLDWRDTDNLHRLNGAEQDYYEELPEPYIPRNGRIEDSAEFFLVSGTELLRDSFAAEDVFTVYARQAQININSLGPAMLDFVAGGDEEIKAAYYQALEDYQALNPALARQVLGDERFDLLKPYLSYNEGGCRYYSLVATARVGPPPEERGEESAGAGETEERPEDRRPATTISALIRRDAGGQTFLSWRQIDS